MSKILYLALDTEFTAQGCISVQMILYSNLGVEIKSYFLIDESIDYHVFQKIKKFMFFKEKKNLKEHNIICERISLRSNINWIETYLKEIPKLFPKEKKSQ